MSKLKRASNPIYTFFPIEVEGFDSLGELALNMRWSWNHADDEVWAQLDPEQGWTKLHFGDTTIANNCDQHVFEVQVYLNGIDPDSVRVELYAEGVNGSGPVRMDMTRGPKLVGAESGYLFGAQVLAARPATDYTARVIPHRAGLAIPLEANQILWQR